MTAGTVTAGTVTTWSGHRGSTSTSPRERSGAKRRSITTKFAEISENRAGIEQAKGMLMLIYGIGESAAFDLLRWLSQETNVKLRPLAEQIAEDFRGRPGR